MKKVLVVSALLAVMLVVGSLKQAGASSAATLAGIGFVVLAAYAVAELGKAIGLPQVTGYILAGVVLGPSVGGIISGQVVSEMRMFNTLALGLIATSAGLELDVRQVLRLGKTLVLTTLVKIVVGASLVAATLLAVETALGSLGLESRAEIICLALVMGALSVGTSPSISLAVLSETKAKGRLADLVLGAAVFKDLVVVVGLAIAVAVSRVVLQPGASLDASVLLSVSLELGGSLLAGSLVGLVLIAYVHFIGAEMLLFVAAMILVVAELCRTFHLELLLVFIAAGFTVRNFSKFEHTMARPLALVALPVFVVFFANAGASVDLLRTWKILPLALALCTVRALSYVLASRLGGKWAGEPRVVQRHAWLAYLPQAGVTLGLVGVAALQLPELATPITTTGMAVVAINLLVGPITLRRALGLAGELPAADAIPNSQAISSRPGAAAAPPPPPPSEPTSAPLSVLPEATRQAHAQVESALLDALERFSRDTAPHLPALPPLGADVPPLDSFRNILTDRRAAYRALYAELTRALGQLPAMVSVDVYPEHRRGRRTRRWLSATRKLPLRRLARIALVPAIAQYIARAFEDGLRHTPPASPESSPSGGALPAEILIGLGRFTELLSEATRLRLSSRRLRYSSVEPQVRKALQSLASDSETDLARLVQAAWGSRLLDFHAEQTAAKLRDAVERSMVRPAQTTVAKVAPAIELLRQWLHVRQTELEANPISSLGVAHLQAEFEKLTKSALSEVLREFRFSATLRTTIAEMKASVATIPASIECLALEPGAPLTQGKVASVRLRDHVESLLRQLMPAIDVAARSVSNALTQVPRRVADATEPEWTLLAAQLEGAFDEEARALGGQRLAQAQRLVQRVNRVSTRAVQAGLDTLHASIESACAIFAAGLLPGASLPGGRNVQLQSQLARLGGSLRRWRGTLATLLHGKAPLADVAAVRRALRVPEQPLPQPVLTWFDSAPVADERIFAAHRALLETIVDAESARNEVDHQSVLIVGPKGSGKSSLLNICEIESLSSAHLRLHAADFTRDTSLFEALGAVLECAPSEVSLSRQLALHRPAVFVDDLASWVSSSVDRQAELQRIAYLMARTRKDAFWVVTIDGAMLRLFSELIDIEEVFTHVLRLPRLTLAEVRRVLESRLRLLHVEVRFAPTRWGRLLDKLAISREKDRFYRALWSASSGIPARVVALARAALRWQDQVLELQADALHVQPPLEYRFSESQLAILATLHRYGSQMLDRLQVDLALTYQELERSAAFLSGCGLVQHADEGHALRIAPAAEWVVFQALERARLVVTEEA